jgi:hypothetical protein
VKTAVLRLVILLSLAFYTLCLLYGCGGGGDAPVYKVTRAQAISRVKSDLIMPLPDDERAQVAVYCRSAPLAVGDKVQPVQLDGWSGGDYEAAAPVWFMMVDYFPYHKFLHPVKYVFLDAETGAMTTRDALWWPRINGAALWGRGEERLADGNAERVWPESGLPLSRAVSLPVVAHSGHRSAASREPDPCDGKEAKKVAVVIGGSNEHAIQEDTKRARDVLSGIGFNVHGHDPAGSDLEKIIQDIEALTKDLGPCDKFLFYFTGHGSDTGVLFGGDKDNATRWNFSGNIGAIVGPNNKVLPSIANVLKKIPAGHIEIFIDSCQSGGCIAGVNDAFAGSTKSLVGATSTDSREEAGYDPLGIIADAGSHWSKAFWACMKEHLKNAPKNIAPKDLEQIERQCRQEANARVPKPKPQVIDNGK